MADKNGEKSEVEAGGKDPAAGSTATKPKRAPKRSPRKRPPQPHRLSRLRPRYLARLADNITIQSPPHRVLQQPDGVQVTHRSKTNSGLL